VGTETLIIGTRGVGVNVMVGDNVMVEVIVGGTGVEVNAYVGIVGVKERGAFWVYSAITVCATEVPSAFMSGVGRRGVSQAITASRRINAARYIRPKRNIHTPFASLKT
jgi:hypothetical protein